MTFKDESCPGKREKVQVWVYSKNNGGIIRFLLLRTLPARGGFWQPVTGGVEPGESLDGAAQREAVEETSLTFKNPPWSLGHEFTFEARGLNFHEHVFAVEAQWCQEVVVDSHEHDAWEWVTLVDARKKVRHASNVEALEILVHRLGLPVAKEN